VPDARDPRHRLALVDRRRHLCRVGDAVEIHGGFADCGPWVLSPCLSARLAGTASTLCGGVIGGAGVQPDDRLECRAWLGVAGVWVARRCFCCLGSGPG
jgi:hypothetical protein